MNVVIVNAPMQGEPEETLQIQGYTADPAQPTGYRMISCEPLTPGATRRTTVPEYGYILIVGPQEAGYV